LNACNELNTEFYDFNVQGELEESFKEEQLLANKKEGAFF
jgi:hypothetical protein